VEFGSRNGEKLCDEVLKEILNRVFHQSKEIVCEGDLEKEIVKAC
jgi:hypothetical protein